VEQYHRAGAAYGFASRIHQGCQLAIALQQRSRHAPMLFGCHQGDSSGAGDQKYGNDDYAAEDERAPANGKIRSAAPSRPKQSGEACPGSTERAGVDTDK
jgi:hypothetical protein